MVFQKVPFEKFLHESIMHEYVEASSKELVHLIWETLKEPKVTEKQCIFYSPWPFHIAEGKDVYLPTGYIPKEDAEYTYKESQNFEYNNKPKTGKHFIAKITAKRNTCINEGDPFMVCFIKEGD